MGSLVDWTLLRKESQSEDMSIETFKLKMQRDQRLKKTEKNIQIL